MRAGEWAFGIYMAHFTVLLLLPVFGLENIPWAEAMLAVAGSIGAGALAFRFIEKPLGDAMRKGLLRISGAG